MKYQTCSIYLILEKENCKRNQYIDGHFEEEITPFVEEDQQVTRNLINKGSSVKSTYQVWFVHTNY